MKKKLLSLIVALAMVGTLAACGGSGDAESTAESTAAPAAGSEAAESTAESAAEDAAEEAAAPAAAGDIHVGIVVKSLADQHWALVKAGAEAKAAELGVAVDVIGPNSESDVQAQVDMIDNLVGQQVDALCVAPSSQDAVLIPLQNADDAGIPILTIDTDTTFENRLSFIGTGNEAAAYEGGKAAAEVVGEGAKVVILRGRLGDATHDQREAGFQKAIDEAGLEVLEVKAADSDAEKAMNIMQDLTQVYEQIDLVLSTTDNQTLGAQRAIEAAGVDTQIMSFDGTTNVCELIQEGKILGSVAQNPFAMGQLAVENAVKAVQGESVEAVIDSGSEVVMAGNVDTYLADLIEKTA